MQKTILFVVMLFATALSSTWSQNRNANFPQEETKPATIPNRSNVWVFIMAGQSNMAGRGMVEPEDTIPNNRILTINAKNEIIIAKEPLHFYEPKMTGLDCGVSFAQELLTGIPDSVSILMIPTAVGGSSVLKWISDSPHRGVHLQSNFKAKAELAKKYGEIKGILWHQGESDMKADRIKNRQNHLNTLFTEFRTYIGNKNLPILMGKLGSYSKEPKQWKKMNKQITKYANKDKYAVVVKTKDFVDRGDKLHFNSEGQREIGKRYAKAYLKKFTNQ